MVSMKLLFVLTLCITVAVAASVADWNYYEDVGEHAAARSEAESEKSDIIESAIQEFITKRTLPTPTDLSSRGTVRSDVAEKPLSTILASILGVGLGIVGSQVLDKHVIPAFVNGVKVVSSWFKKCKGDCDENNNIPADKKGEIRTDD